MRVRGPARNEAILVPYDRLPAMRPRRAQRSARVASMTGERMTLHTVQTPAAWERLADVGVLRADPDRVDPYFVRPYAWLSEQMTARGLPGDGMVWAWAQIRPRDLRLHLDCSEPSVMLTLDVSADRVLATHYGDWHCVLNNWPWLDIAADEPLDEVVRRMQDVERRGPAAVEATWAAVFDPAWWSAESAIQATVREVRAEDVVRAVRLLPPRRLRMPSALWH